MIDGVDFPADDLERARRFWDDVLGADVEAAGIDVHARGDVPEDRGTLAYFAVEDLGAALERVVELGGEVLQPGERSAVCRDSEGNRFGLRAVEPARAAGAQTDRGFLESYTPATWGDHLADVYEEWLASTPVETEGAIEVLVELARGGPVLELAVGTGRIAIPLAERGLEVRGVDASKRMVEKLRARPGGDRVEVTIGDFADVPVDGRFPLIFVVFNTFPALLSPEDQVRCVANVAEHLTDDGLFLVEMQVPPAAMLRREGSIDVWGVEPGRVIVGFERADPVTQTSAQMEVWITERGVRMFPNPCRYVWPSELDLMARLAGLELRERWAGWRREPFTRKSPSHVSIYGRAARGGPESGEA